MTNILHIFKYRRNSKKCHIFTGETPEDLCGVTSLHRIESCKGFEGVEEYLNSVGLTLCEKCKLLCIMRELGR